MSKEPCPIGYGPCRLHVSRAFLVPSPLHMRADILDAGVGLLLVNLVSTVLHGVLYRGKGSEGYMIWQIICIRGGVAVGGQKGERIKATKWA